MAATLQKPHRFCDSGDLRERLALLLRRLVAAIYPEGADAEHAAHRHIERLARRDMHHFGRSQARACWAVTTASSAMPRSGRLPAIRSSSVFEIAACR
jgi:hypothetical protein